jgi:hypothetical protein
LVPVSLVCSFNQYTVPDAFQISPVSPKLIVVCAYAVLPSLLTEADAVTYQAPKNPSANSDPALATIVAPTSITTHANTIIIHFLFIRASFSRSKNFAFF